MSHAKSPSIKELSLEGDPGELPEVRVWVGGGSQGMH